MKGNEPLSAALTRFLATASEADFGPIFADLYPRVRRYFLLHRLNKSDAEELTQDVALIVFRRGSMLRDPALFRGWVFRIAHNVMLQRLRQPQVETQSLMGLEVIAPTEQAFEIPADWMAELDSVSRQILILRFVEDLSYQEIAEALQLPIGTVKWKLYTAKQRVSGHLSKHIQPSAQSKRGSLWTRTSMRWNSCS